jgi:hypothetical protein
MTRIQIKRFFIRLGALLCFIAACVPSFATTKGLNQIVTPDIQPVGVLSTSLQLQNPVISNGQEVQLELGLTKNFEVAVFRGFTPGETIFNAELGLVQSKHFLLSTGVLGVEQGKQAQPFIEAGYYQGKGFGMVGIQHQDSNEQGIFGLGYQYTPKVLLTADYITGSQNFATVGVTFTITPNLSFNPALYVSNSTPRHGYGYGVLTWNSKLW